MRSSVPWQGQRIGKVGLLSLKKWDDHCQQDHPAGNDKASGENQPAPLADGGTFAEKPAKVEFDERTEEKCDIRADAGADAENDRRSKRHFRLTAPQGKHADARQDHDAVVKQAEFFPGADQFSESGGIIPVGKGTDGRWGVGIGFGHRLEWEMVYFLVLAFKAAILKMVATIP